jgi:hypothetical protein
MGTDEQTNKQETKQTNTQKISRFRNNKLLFLV